MGSLNFYKLLGGRRFWGFMFSFLLLWACKSDPVDPENPDIKKPDPSTFGFTLLKITDVKEISVERLKKQLKSESGWTIKSIKIDDESFAEVKGSLPNLKIILKKSGTFTASITLQKKGWQDFVLKDCKIQVVLPQFSFSKFTQSKSKKTITSADILKQIAGAQAAGYAIKSIVVSDENFAKVSGAAPKLQIDIKKPGKFTATIVLSHKSFFEITLKDCAFEIVPEFIFSKLTRSISGSKTITAADLLKQIAGAVAAGYTIKSIAITEDTKKLATANGTAITLDLKKTGIFKATIILKKDQHSDITLTDCEFEISGKKPAPTLTFTKLSRKFSTAPITKAEILKQIKQDITGWTLKNVVLSNASFGDVDSNFSIRLKKIGNFSATLTFERAGYVSAQVTGSFEITKGLAASLKFTELKRSFKGDKIITAARILGQIANVKTLGYGLKSIGKIDNPDVASASGTQITIKKVGSFTAELVLESANYEDARVQASFEISGKNAAPVLSFATLKRNYSGSKTITKAQILNQITATSGQADWAGYVLKSIVLTENVSLARVNNSKFEVTILKAGTFKARLTFTRDSYVDALVTGTFEIAKVAAPILGFTPISKKFGGSNTISKTEILNKITGNKTDYVLKSIVPSDNSFASVSAAFEMTLRRAGNFTATITLSRENYEDAVIQNCSFKIALGDAPTDLRLTGFTRNFADSRTITAADIFAKINGKKDGYVLKSISINSGNDVATVRSNQKEITIQKAGTFTADIVLERANYKDATIANVIFTIQKAAAPTGLSFTKLKKVFGQTITAADILANVKGSGKTGYTLKSIAITSGGDVAALSGLKEIVSKKIGTFAATLVLEKANYEGVTIRDADFEIVKGTAPKLTFTKFTGQFSGGVTETITATQILEKIGGKKDGYSLKSLTGLDGNIAELSGTKPNFEIIVKKAATFTVEITLERAHFADAKVTGTFTIAKGVAKALSFSSYDKLNNDKNNAIVTGAKLGAYVSGAKYGYTILKDVTGISDDDVAALSGTGKIIIKKEGNFSVGSLTLESDKYEDVIFTNKNFSYTNIFNVLGGELKGYNDDKYKTSIKLLNFASVVDGKRVTSIGRLAFLQTNLNSVTTPSSVTAIGQFAFFQCYYLTSVTLGDGLTTIGDMGFQECRRLTSITIPNSVTAIGSSTFYGCSSLTSVTIPDKVTAIANDLFKGCYKLASVTMHSDITTIGQSAFENSSLTSVTIPNKVTTIANGLFKGCSKLASVTMHSNVATIGQSAFENSGLTSVTIPSKVTTIAGALFKGCSKLASVTMHSDITTIGQRAFENSGLTSVTIPNKVTAIANDLFKGCTKLASVTMHSEITTIGQRAFENSGLTSVTIPSKVTTIAGALFKGCSKLASVTMHSDITTIGQRAFENSGLTSVTIPNKVTAIANDLFKGCTKLASVTMHSEITTIGQRAFENSGLTSVTIPSKVTAIANGLFKGCTKLASVTMHSEITTIGEGAFENSADLTAITIYSKVTTIGNRAFYNCQKLIVTLTQTNPNSITLGTYSFGHVTNIGTISYRNAVIKIVVPVSSFLSYRNSDRWSLYVYKIKES